MKTLRVTLYVLLTLLASPWVISHGCVLGSWPSELAIVFALLVYPLVLMRGNKDWYPWKLVIAAPFLSLTISGAYFLWLHSEYFPRPLLNRSAIESVDRMKTIKQQQTTRGQSHVL